MVIQCSSDVYVRKPDVRKITGLSDSTIWRLEQKKQFPQRRRLSSNAAGWLLSEIQMWLSTRPVAGGGDE